MLTINSQRPSLIEKRKKFAKDILAGITVYSATTILGDGIIRYIANTNKKNAHIPNAQEFKQKTSFLINTINKEMSINPGITVTNLANVNPYSYIKKLDELKIIHEKNLKGKNLFEKIKLHWNFAKQKKLYKKYFTIAKGNNASFFNSNNKIVINLDKRGLSIFHEIGHAINYNKDKFWGSMQKIRKYSKRAPLILLAAGLLIPAKQKDEKTKGFIDKTLSFVKNNTGKLTFISLLPIVAEEFRATILGNQFAKTLLPKQYKQIAKANFLSGVTYLVGTLFTSFAVSLASKCRD